MSASPPTAAPLRGGLLRYSCGAVWTTGVAFAVLLAWAGPTAVAKTATVTHAAAATGATANTSASAPNSYNIYWGDLHTHSSYSDDAADLGNTTPPSGSMAYARDVSHLDFMALTDHAEWLTADEWANTQVQANAAYVPGSFVPFIGFEYTNSPVQQRSGQGHKCVIFAGTTVLPLPLGWPDTKGPEDLWTALAGYQAITIPHHPAKGHTAGMLAGMSTDWDHVNAELQPLVEIYSTHGGSEAAGAEEPVHDFQDDRSVEAALMRWLDTHDPGYKLGIGASTDTHLSKPGSVQENEEFVEAALEGPYTGGLIAALATEKTRPAIFDALNSKRTYGTSGPRIMLEFSARFADQETIMGGTLRGPKGALPVELSVSAQGDTAPIDRIQLIKNGVLLSEVHGATLRITDIADDWSYYRVKVFQEPTARWDGVMTPERAWSSPIWVEMADEPRFTDIGGNLYEAAINAMAAASMIGGYVDDTFRPQEPVKRAQFAKMIVEALGLPVVEGAVPCPFTDVDTPSDSLYPDDYVAVAAANEITRGTTTTTFSPYNDISRAQVITMIVRAADRFAPGLLDTPPAGYQGNLDASDPTHGANIARAEYGGLLDGIPTENWSTAATADRGEVAQMLYNLLAMAEWNF